LPSTLYNGSRLFSNASNTGLKDSALNRTRNIGIIAHIDAVGSSMIHSITFKPLKQHRGKLQPLSECSIIVAIQTELEVNLTAI
jgi:hypothetical protein